MSVGATVRRREGEEIQPLAGTRGASRYVVPLGRLLISLIFLMTFLTHFSGGAAGYAAQHGVPIPRVLVPLAGVIAILGGMSVLLGYHARAGAWLLVIFLVPVSLFMHDFWNVTDPMMRMDQQAHFMKNVAMLGGALLITWFGAGPISLDARRLRRTVLRADGRDLSPPDERRHARMDPRAEGSE